MCAILAISRPDKNQDKYFFVASWAAPGIRKTKISKEPNAQIAYLTERTGSARVMVSPDCLTQVCVPLPKPKIAALLKSVSDVQAV